MSPTPAENLPSIWEPRVQPRRRGAVPPFPLFSETRETRVEGTFPSVLLLGHGTANEQHAGHNALRACEERLRLWMESPDEEQLLFTLNLSRSSNINHIFLSPLITVLKTKPSSDTHANDVFVHRLLRLRSGDCPGPSSSPQRSRRPSRASQPVLGKVTVQASCFQVRPEVEDTPSGSAATYGTPTPSPRCGPAAVRP